MNVRTRKRFFADLGKIRDLDVLDEIEVAFDEAHRAGSMEEVPGFKFLVHHPGRGAHPRIRLPDWR